MNNIKLTPSEKRGMVGRITGREKGGRVSVRAALYRIRVQIAQNSGVAVVIAVILVIAAAVIMMLS
jgi:hypothetical protein